MNLAVGVNAMVKSKPKSSATDLAKRFARSLDQEDYASTAECLAPACQYEIAGKVHSSAGAILASYRKSREWAARTLDGIQYESRVQPGAGGAVVVEFIDHLEHAGLTHTHRSEQHLRFDEHGLISHIRHIDLVGEQEALDQFFAAVGVSRSTPATSSSNREHSSHGVKTMVAKTSKKPAKVAPSKIRFTAKLHRPTANEKSVSEDWTFLNLPKQASAKLPSRSMVSVEGTINGAPFQATFEPDGQGGHWLKVDRRLREAAGAEVGDVVTLEIVPMSEEPEPKVPADVRKALAAAPAKARETWSDITPAARRDFIHWITSGKRAETRVKRIETACDKLAKGMRRPCCFDRSGMYDKSLSCPVAEP